MLQEEQTSPECQGGIRPTRFFFAQEKIPLDPTKDTRMVKPGFYAVPPQNIFEISPGFQLVIEVVGRLALYANHCIYYVIPIW